MPNKIGMMLLLFDGMSGCIYQDIFSKWWLEVFNIIYQMDNLHFVLQKRRFIQFHILDIDNIRDA
jgi:hypothetical protein